MFISVRFSPTDAKPYTYQFDGDKDDIGEIGYVETSQGMTEVTVCEIDLPEPPFACKPITFTPPAGHNDPPDLEATAVEPESDADDPLDDLVAEYGGIIEESENWLDGNLVENEAQMNAVDALRKEMRQARLAAAAGQKAEAAPLHDAWKAELAKWKPTIDDFKRIEDGLVALVGAFKTKLAAKKKADQQAAWDAANKARMDAEAKAAQANAADLDDQREAAAAKQAAIDAEKDALAKAKDTVKGMRKVHKYDIENHREALNWIAKNDRDAITDFIENYVEKNHKTKDIDGVKQWIIKEAY